MGVPQSNHLPSLSAGTLAGAWGRGHHYPERLPWPGLGPWEASKAFALGPTFKWMPKVSKRILKKIHDGQNIKFQGRTESDPELA